MEKRTEILSLVLSELEQIGFRDETRAVILMMENRFSTPLFCNYFDTNVAFATLQDFLEERKHDFVVSEYSERKARILWVIGFITRMIDKWRTENTKSELRVPVIHREVSEEEDGWGANVRFLGTDAWGDSHVMRYVYRTRRAARLASPDDNAENNPDFIRSYTKRIPKEDDKKSKNS